MTRLPPYQAATRPTIRTAICDKKQVDLDELSRRANNVANVFKDFGCDLHYIDPGTSLEVQMNWPSP